MDTRSPTPLRRRALRLAQGGLYWSGIVERLPHRGGASILMYHSVAAPDTARYVDFAWRMTEQRFEQQLRFLARHRNVISLSELVEQLKDGIEPKPGTVVLTFDDGYRDNLEVAAPILRRYNLPATIFLATAYITRGENQWVDRLYTLFTARTRQRCELAPYGKAGVAQAFDLKGARQCRLAYMSCALRLLEASFPEREKILARLENELQPLIQPPCLTLNWDEVRELSKRYPEFEIGVHTAHHVDLSRCSADAVREELHRCIQDVEREVGVRPRHFSFPYGRSSPLACRLVAEAGLQSAMGPGGQGQFDSTADSYCLPRLDALMSPTQLRLRTHPGFPALPGRLAKGV